jgi:hypothetical protein
MALIARIATARVNVLAATRRRLAWLHHSNAAFEIGSPPAWSSWTERCDFSTIVDISQPNSERSDFFKLSLGSLCPTNKRSQWIT